MNELWSVGIRKKFCESKFNTEHSIEALAKLRYQYFFVISLTGIIIYGIPIAFHLKLITVSFSKTTDNKKKKMLIRIITK